MTQKPTISREDTTRFLQEKFNKEISELTALSGGEWSQAYSFLQNHKKYVLRWCNSSETFEKDAVARSFSCEAMPIPKIMDKGVSMDKYFAISEFAHGNFIDTLAVVELEHTLPALFKLFDALRNSNISNTRGYGGWNKDGSGSHNSWKEYLLEVKSDQEGSLTHGWYTNLANSPSGTKLFDQLYFRLGSLVDTCPEVRELIHADLLHHNVLVSGDNISAVIDWQCSLYGDSLYDIAWFMYYASCRIGVYRLQCV